MHIRLAAASLMLFLLSTVSLYASPIDSTLYTQYFFNETYTTIYWGVCGSAGNSNGCYDSGEMGPFGYVGAMIEGNPAQNIKASTVTRYIYVVDVAYGPAGNGVELYIYKKVDTIKNNYDYTTVTLYKSVSLPLTGGSSAVASMAANSQFLFVGTNLGTNAVEVKKSTLAITNLSGESPPINFSSVTADAYGYVTVMWGDFTTSNNAETTFNQKGEAVQSGAPGMFMLSTIQGVSTSTLP